MPLVNGAMQCLWTAAEDIALIQFESLKDFHDNNPVKLSFNLFHLKEKCFSTQVLFCRFTYGAASIHFCRI